MNDGCCSFDYEFERYAEDTGFLTNFSEYLLPSYESSLAKCREVFPDISIIVGKGWNSSYALYRITERRDLSGWWRVFESAECEFKNANRREETIKLAEKAGFYFHTITEYSPTKHTVAFEYSESCFHRFVEILLKGEK